MKRYFSLFLVLLLLISVFAACGKDDTVKSTDITTTTVAVETPDVTESATTSDDSDNLNSEEQVTVIDNEYCTLTIDGIEYDELWGYSINTSFVNKTADKKLVATLNNLSVAKVQFDVIYYCEAASGKTAKDNISIITSDEEAEVMGDKPVFNLSFEVSDADDYLGEALAETSVIYSPFGAVEYVYEREMQESDIVLVDNDALSVTVTSVEEDDITGYTLNLFIVNKTDKEIMISAEDVSINGLMADPYFAKSVAEGNSCFAQMYWLLSDFEELGITEVSEIELTVRAYDYNDIFAGDIVNEKVTINP